MKISTPEKIQIKYLEIKNLLDKFSKKSQRNAIFLFSIIIIILWISALWEIFSVLLFLVFNTIAWFILIPLFIGLLGSPILYIILNLLISDFLKKLSKINTIYINEINYVEKTEQILLKLIEIKKIMNYIMSFNLWYFIWKEILQVQIDYLLMVISDLRSDLALRLTEQQNLLEYAKSEVSENIKWTTELESISELQKVRLDKQIEQFEELQRVLVKV